MPPDKDVDEDSRDQTECAVLIETDKTKPDALKPVFSTDSLASSNLINVPSKSELAVYNDVSCSESELEAPLLERPTAKPKRENVIAGMLWYAASSIFFAGMGITSKMLGHKGYTVWEITFFRSVVILTISLAVLVSQGISPWGTRKLLLILRGTLGYGSITCYFLACQMLPLADATALTFLAPLIAALLSPFVLKERLSLATVFVIPLCIVGVTFITKPSFFFNGGGRGLPLAGVVIGLLQPFFSATAKMTVRFLRTTEPTNVMIFYLMLCTLVYSIIGCAATHKQLIVPTNRWEIMLLIGQGLFGFGNQVCITKGLANARAASVMCMQYFSIVISQLAGMLLFREFTSWIGDAGMVLIVLSMVVYMKLETGRKQRR